MSSGDLYIVYASAKLLCAFQPKNLSSNKISELVSGNRPDRKGDWYGAEATSPGMAVREALMAGYEAPVGAKFNNGKEEVVNVGGGVISYRKSTRKERNREPNADGNLLHLLF